MTFISHAQTNLMYQNVQYRTTNDLYGNSMTEEGGEMYAQHSNSCTNAPLLPLGFLTGESCLLMMLPDQWHKTCGPDHCRGTRMKDKFLHRPQTQNFIKPVQ